MQHDWKLGRNHVLRKESSILQMLGGSVLLLGICWVYGAEMRFKKIAARQEEQVVNCEANPLGDDETWRMPENVEKGYG